MNKPASVKRIKIKGSGDMVLRFMQEGRYTGVEVPAEPILTVPADSVDVIKYDAHEFNRRYRRLGAYYGNPLIAIEILKEE
jgi:hypothetical protein